MLHTDTAGLVSCMPHPKKVAYTTLKRSNFKKGARSTLRILCFPPVWKGALEPSDGSKAAQQAKSSRNEEGEGQLHSSPLCSPPVTCLMHPCKPAIPPRALHLPCYYTKELRSSIGRRGCSNNSAGGCRKGGTLAELWSVQPACEMTLRPSASRTL